MNKEEKMNVQVYQERYFVIENFPILVISEPNLCRIEKRPGSVNLIYDEQAVASLVIKRYLVGNIIRISRTRFRPAKVIVDDVILEDSPCRLEPNSVIEVGETVSVYTRGIHFDIFTGKVVNIRTVISHARSDVSCPLAVAFNAWIRQGPPPSEISPLSRALLLQIARITNTYQQLRR